MFSSLQQPAASSEPRCRVIRKTFNSSAFWRCCSHLQRLGATTTGTFCATQTVCEINTLTYFFASIFYMVRGCLQISMDDPRGPLESRKVRKGRGQNTASFDPSSTLHRPDVRVRVLDRTEACGTISADDMIVIPKAFAPGILETMLAESDALAKSNPEASFQSWHEGCHLLAKEMPQTANTIAFQLMRLFDVDPKTAAVRYNFYNGNSDWKALHNDSAAFNSQRARVQNVTIGASFGDERELILHNARGNVDMRFPCPDGSVYCFGKSVNIRFTHGIAAVPPAEYDATRKRISIIVWGFSRKMRHEDNDPPLIRQDVPPHRAHTRPHNSSAHASNAHSDPHNRTPRHDAAPRPPHKRRQPDSESASLNPPRQAGAAAPGAAAPDADARTRHQPRAGARRRGKECATPEASPVAG